mgnify:CR=1 FL=1|tara:strand:- start:379 stop:1077 length:699 start_codon:yes stop_codon:yes gene_type:complete
MKKKSKRLNKLIDLKKKEKIETLENKIDLIKKMSNTKFVESIDLSFKINLKKVKGADSNLRTIVELPNGSGKKFKIAVLCDENKLNDAKKSGAEVFGSDDLIQKISSGQLNFDKLVCTPSMMSKLGKLGKVLGPKGLMPNPKLGTVSDDLVKTVSKIKNKIVEIKNDKDGNVGLSIGRKSFATSKIIENINSLFQNLKKDKSTIFNPENVKKIYLSSSMSPSLKINFKEVQA